MTGQISPPDVRWKQRFQNFKKALAQLAEFESLGQLSKFEQQGFIKSFEYTFELAWNVIKDFYEAQGELGLQGSRDAFRLAFRRGLITEGDVWMAMIQSRIQTAHTHNEIAANEVVSAVRTEYLAQFEQLRAALEHQA